MRIRVVLHSVLREKLPPETGGRIELEIAEGGTILDLMRRLSLPEHSVCAVNGQIERSLQRVLQEGDEVRFFRAGAGG